MGMIPKHLSDRLFDAAMGRSYFRRWATGSLDGLREAAETDDSA
jgi:hypothetical protein